MSVLSGFGVCFGISSCSMAEGALRLLQDLPPRFSRVAATAGEGAEAERLVEELYAIESLPDRQAGPRLRE